MIISEEYNEMWEILVPTITNAGKPIRKRHHKEWDKQVRKITGGLTIISPIKGQWVSKEGILFVERMIPVRIVTDRNTMIQKVVPLTLKFYDQLAVLVYKISDMAMIIHKN